MSPPLNRRDRNYNRKARERGVYDFSLSRGRYAQIYTAVITRCTYTCIHKVFLHLCLKRMLSDLAKINITANRFFLNIRY